MSKKYEMEYVRHLNSIGVDKDELLSNSQGMKFFEMMMSVKMEENESGDAVESMVISIVYRMNKIFEDYCYE